MDVKINKKRSLKRRENVKNVLPALEKNKKFRFPNSVYTLYLENTFVSTGKHTVAFS